MKHTEQIVTFQFEKPPVPQGRPRVNCYTGNAYDPLRSRIYKQQLGSHVRSIMRECDLKPFQKDIPLKMCLTVVKTPPLNWSKKKKQDAYNHFIFPTNRPDLSNYLKGIEDALNGIVYEDDSAIVAENIYKVYGEYPCIRVMVYEHSEECDF